MTYQQTGNGTPRQQLIEQLKVRREWYRQARRLYNTLWNSFTLLIVICTAAASIVAALNYGKLSSEALQILMVVLPAIASLLSTILVQFRVRENWQLRELGRLDIEELLLEAQRLQDSNDAQTQAAIDKLHARALEISRRQASEFFAYLSKSTEPTLDNPAAK